MAEGEKRDFSLGGGDIKPELGAVPDYMNAWTHLGFGLMNLNRPELINLTKPIRSYEEYIKETYGERADDLLSRSNPEVVAKINSLADFANQNASKLVEQKDYQTLKDIYDKASVLIRGYEHFKRQ